MLKLSSGPFWLDLIPGVRVEVDPVTTAGYLLARQAARVAVETSDDEGAAEDEVRVGAHVAFTQALAVRGIREWEGVGGEDGEPVEPSREAIIQLLDHYPAFEAFDRLYVGPVVAAEAEKNESSPSRTGSSVTAKATAEDAATQATTAPVPAAKPAP